MLDTYTGLQQLAGYMLAAAALIIIYLGVTK